MGWWLELGSGKEKMSLMRATGDLKATSSE